MKMNYKKISPEIVKEIQSIIIFDYIENIDEKYKKRVYENKKEIVMSEITEAYISMFATIFFNKVNFNASNAKKYYAWFKNITFNHARSVEKEIEKINAQMVSSDFNRMPNSEKEKMNIQEAIQKQKVITDKFNQTRKQIKNVNKNKKICYIFKICSDNFSRFLIIQKNYEDSKQNRFTFTFLYQ